MSQNRGKKSIQAKRFQGCCLIFVLLDLGRFCFLFFFFPLRSKFPQAGGDFERVQPGVKIRCTRSPAPMTAQPLQAFSIATFPLRSFCETMISVSKIPALYSARTSSPSLSRHNCQLCTVWATRQTGWWSLLCDDTKSHAQASSGSYREG